MPNFDFHNIEIGKSRDLDEVVIKGEIYNSSDKSYNTVAVRVILFVNNIIIAMIFPRKSGHKEELVLA